MAFLYRIVNLKAPLDYSPEWLLEQASEKLCLSASHLGQPKVVKESIDARKKPVVFVLQIEVVCQVTAEHAHRDARLVERSALDIPGPTLLDGPSYKGDERAIVVGAGPAGYFAALVLAEAGVPTLLLERGKPVDTRMRDIGQLRSHGTLDPESNVCFGEGGAGAYTDGKLYTRIKHPHVRWVMKRLVDFGAPEEILVKAHPHLGTDKLVRLVRQMREYLEQRGVEFRFDCRVERLITEAGSVSGVKLANGEELQASHVIMGIGHSARDTLANLLEDGVVMEAKPFAVGVRAEHPQALINQCQYGSPERHPALGAAAYALTHQVNDPHMEQRGIYSFCMCPGGFIVPSPTEPQHMAINGMSNANRSTAFANSGVVVQITPEDLFRHGFAESPLVGIAFQRHLEEKVFAATQQPYAAPAMRIDEFIARKPTGSLAPTNFRPALEAFDLWQILPRWIAEPLREGLMGFNRKLRGYSSSEANILAVESRTSSPIRITRDSESLESISMKGLFPVGEGAGYAGGIVSAAVDGIKAAERIVSKLI